MNVGFIGAGNMATAMIKGILQKGIAAPENIFVSDASASALDRARENYSVRTFQINKEVSANCQVLFLAVKPQQYPQVIAEIASSVNDDAIVVTIAPGITIASLESLFQKPVKLVRTMPNTPALVGEGMTAYVKSPQVSENEFLPVQSILECFGKCAEVPEKLMDAVVGVSGSAPAYVYMFIEALADGAVMHGMPRNLAYEFAAQAVMGSAKMVQETGLHPGALKDMVCSPAGTTIAAVAKLEEKGFRSAVIEAVDACIKKSASLG